MAETLYAGFARVDITPEVGGVPLAGYGGYLDAAKRLAARVLDPIYCNAVALKGGDETCVMLTLDICEVHYNVFYPWRDAICEATGLPKERVFIGSTHTHSSIDICAEKVPSVKHYNKEEMPVKLVEAARRALTDLKPAKIFYGSMEVGTPELRLNWTRHYLSVEKEKVNDWKPEDLHVMLGEYTQKKGYVPVAHHGETDHSLQLLRLVRENADDIILLNFAAHATITGGTRKGDLSADFTEAFIHRLEELQPGTKCTFLQGCCGNLVGGTRIAKEGIPGVTFGKYRDYRAYGSALAGYAMEIIDAGLTESETSTLSVAHCDYTAKPDHSMDELAKKATPILEKNRHVVTKEQEQEIRDLCHENGFYGGIYHCIYAYKKSQWPETGTFEINAIRLGDCAIVTNPFEMFSETGLHIKSASPFAMTMVKSFSCGYENYLPAKGAFDRCYEVNVTHYELGTAEKLEEKFHEMLCELKK